MSCCTDKDMTIAAASATCRAIPSFDFLMAAMRGASLVGQWSKRQQQMEDYFGTEVVYILAEQGPT